jgi:hypothetical protein
LTGPIGGNGFTGGLIGPTTGSLIGGLVIGGFTVPGKGLPELVGFDTIGPIGRPGRTPPAGRPLSVPDLMGDETRLAEVEPTRLAEPARLTEPRRIEPMLRLERLPPERLAPPCPPFPPAYTLLAKAAAIAATPIVNLLVRFISHSPFCFDTLLICIPLR